MASTALPHTTHSQESLQQRMEQYHMGATASPEEEGHSPPPEVPTSDPTSNVASEAVSSGPGSDYPPYVRNMMSAQQATPDPYQYTEASVTSGSNSGEEDDRTSDVGSNKRLGGHLNGFSSKKRRKQSKPMRMGPDVPEEQPSQSGQGEGRDEEEEEGLVNSTTPELEDGERRPTGGPMGGMDLPLNLSAAAAAAAAHPTLRVLGAELLQNPDKIPTSVASLYQGMLSGNPPFGIPQFPFPFPGSSSRPPTTSVSQGSTPMTSGGRPQIFNPEAYCELCNKEFCNKYFLKTHKANKHGIYSEGIPMSGSPPTSSSPSNGGMPHHSASGGMEPGERPQLVPSSSSQANSGGNGPPTPSSQAGSPFSGAFIAANMGALRPPFMPLSPGASPSPKDQANPHAPRDAPSRDSQPRDDADSPGILRRPGGNGPSIPGAPMMSPREPGTIPDFRQAVEERERLMQRDSGGLPKENGELRKSLESPQRAPSTPGQMPQIPGLPPHLNFNPLMFGGLPSLESLRKEDLEAAAAAAGIKRPPIPNIPNVPNVSLASGVGPPPGTVPKGPFTPEKLRQMGVINADAFCEICCKEFCNKYFLRVHKLKKHGICSPDLPPEKVQKILNQMAKEAGKTGNPPPPIVRPPMSASGGPFGLGSPLGAGDKRSPLPLGPAGLPLRPPAGLLSLPPLEPLLPQALKDYQPKTSMPPPNFSADNNGSPGAGAPSPFRGLQQNQGNSDKEVIRINDDSEDGDGQIRRRLEIEEDMVDDDENASKDRSEHSNGDGMEGPEGIPRGPRGDQDSIAPSEDLQRLQSMIMELNNSKAKSTLMPGGIPLPKDLPEGAAALLKPPHSLSAAAAAAASEASTVCKICNKDMENKYFLRAHMMNEHGVLHTEEPDGSGLGKPPPPPLRSSLDDEGRMPPLINGLDMANAQDFAAKFLQQMQKGLGAAGLPPLDGDDRNFLERVKNELGNLGQMPPGMLGGNGGPLGSPGSPGLGKKLDKDPNKKPASLSRSYCDICKKELCNKYFMKTHMLKMHGINIEATNSAGVNCHICKKELCSKYFLKVHMQNSHGLMEDGSPLPPHMKENGSGLFPGMFPPPPPELLGLSPGGVPPTSSGEGSPSGMEKEMYFSRLLGEQSEMSREKIEKQKMLMQQHKIEDILKRHGALPPDANNFGGLEKAIGTNNVLPTSEAVGSTSPSNSQANSEDQARRPDDRSEGECTPNKAPSTPALGAISNPGTPTSAEMGKQFPHIEMLQRHMLSQQFPGLINPLLSGFPGFPGGPSPFGLPNPLQQLFGQKLPGAEAELSSKDGKDDAPSVPEGNPTKKRRYKCSKCQLKFKKREDCLKCVKRCNGDRLKAVSNRSARQRLQFSPSKMRNRGVRSHYVKRLMEILKVPTSRGTPSKMTSNHIMQAFLIRKEGMEETNNGNMDSAETEAGSSADEATFVPSMVYLPVAKKINQPLTVAFSLTPA